MKNFVQSGGTVTAIAPTGGVSAGSGLLVGGNYLFGICAIDAAEGAETEISTVGVFDIAKAAGAIAAGARVYWDDTAKIATGTATSNRRIGVATVAAGSGDATVRCRLDGVSA